MGDKPLRDFPSQLPAQGSYNPARFSRLSAIEDRHFWFRARNKVITAVVNQITTELSPGYRVLEVGCGTGNVLRFLEQLCPSGLVVGLDLFAQGLQYARQRVSCPLVQGEIHNLPFGAKFDLIALLDVLEHLHDDDRVLRDLYAMLAPTGALLLTVPAHPSLWSYHDEVAYHRRRYELITLENKLTDLGYRVEYITQMMMTIFPLAWLIRRLQKLIGKRLLNNGPHAPDIASNELRIIPIINEFLTLSLNQEIHVMARRRQLPIGTSLLVVARRKG